MEAIIYGENVMVRGQFSGGQSSRGQFSSGTIVLEPLQRVLGKHTPFKKRHARANQQNFMDKELNQIIMVRSKLRSKYLINI